MPWKPLRTGRKKKISQPWWEACWRKKADHYTGKQHSEWSVVTSRDTAAAEDEVHLMRLATRTESQCASKNVCCQAGWGQGQTENGKQPAAQKKRAHTTRQATQTQPALLAAYAFAAALGAIPADGMVRTWRHDRPFEFLKRNSKIVQ